MNYQRIYNELTKHRVAHPSTAKYTERHHILPKSMGGTNHKSNLVVLSAREHYIAHRLLWKIHRNKEMAYAWHMMSMNKKDRNAKQYAKHREAIMLALAEEQLEYTVIHRSTCSFTSDKKWLVRNGISKKARKLYAILVNATDFSEIAIANRMGVGLTTCRNIRRELEDVLYYEKVKTSRKGFTIYLGYDRKVPSPIPTVKL